MPFQKGNTFGNRKGRPKGQDSFAEYVRSRFSKEKRKVAVDRMIELACEPHDDPHARVKAYLALHKSGWPQEQRPDVQVNLPTVPLFAIGVTPSVSQEH